MDFHSVRFGSNFIIISILWVSLFGCSPQLGLRVSKVPSNRTEKHFDRDKNKYLDQYERGLLRTHRMMKWPLANSKLKIKFDRNQNGMLEPMEEENYIKEKKKKKAHYRPIPIKF